jgi:hypothetical protein
MVGITRAATSLGTAAARTLVSTTKSAPQMRGISPRWLLRILPWIDVHGGTYRVTRTVRRAIGRRGSNQPGVVTFAGHHGELTLPGMFVDYELPAREYPMSAAQAILRLHTRVGDLYNQPMNQYQQQLRLTLEALYERQEHELINNPDFGLLHNVVGRHRIPVNGDPPTPSNLDHLISRQTQPRCLLAHPRAIAAFGRECNRRGITSETLKLNGHRVQAWRGFPLLPCDKLTISPGGITSILVLRTGEDRQGVVGLRPIDLPDEHEPGINIRRIGVDQLAVTSYLVSIYFSIAMLIPNCVVALDDVQVNRASE